MDNQCPHAGAATKIHSATSITSRRLSNKHLPGPPGHRIMGSYPEFAKDRNKFLREAIRRYGDVCRIQLPLRDLIVLGNPEDVHRVMDDTSGDYSKFGNYHPAMAKRQNGLSFIEGEIFRERRRIVSPLVTRDGLKSTFQANVDAYLDTLDANIGEATDADGVTDLQEAIFQTLLRGVLKQTYTESFTAKEMRELHEGMATFTKLLGSTLKIADPPNLVRPWGPYKIRPWTVLSAAKIVKDRVVERQNSPALGTYGDVLDGMVLGYKKLKTPMTFWDLCFDVATMTSASYGTTAGAITQTVVRTLLDAEATDRVVEECGTIDLSQPSVDSVRSLRWVRACFEESIRMQGFPLLLRFTAVGGNLQGLDIAPNTMLGAPISAIHRDLRWWTDPDTFDPNRFYDNSKRVDQPRLLHFLAWGAGPHRCTGAQLGYLIAPYLVGLILSRYRVEIPPNWTFREETGLAPTIKGGFRVRLTRR
ncbi:cytochrome P450 [Nocardia sp. CNY236]|uniref:cytochrome P450 n=1 Tax=Nocardia sp. CNY236 TaxID=1169152 RepID=UPI0009DEE9DD|nr:cytochrome P450 [Nocardia sp. CNY236]